MRQSVQLPSTMQIRGEDGRSLQISRQTPLIPNPHYPASSASRDTSPLVGQEFETQRNEGFPSIRNQEASVATTVPVQYPNTRSRATPSASTPAPSLEGDPRSARRNQNLIRDRNTQSSVNAISVRGDRSTRDRGYPRVNNSDNDVLALDSNTVSHHYVDDVLVQAPHGRSFGPDGLK